MSFRENTYCQMSFDDSILNLTVREQRFLENSWASMFAEDLFPMIDEKHSLFCMMIHLLQDQTLLLMLL